MKKLFVSLPMNGLDEDEIKNNIKKLAEEAEKICGEKLELINSLIEEEPPEGVNTPLYYLAKSLELLATADVAIFADGWKEARGCRIEHDASEQYGINQLIVCGSAEAE